MQLPDIGQMVRLFPAPLPDAEPKRGGPLPLRRVQDGATNHGRFLPEEGAERPFDSYWHNRLVAGDVLLSDPRAAFTRATGAPAPAPAPAAPGGAPDAPRANP